MIYAKGFGQRDVEKNLPVTPQTLFAIGSCTKAFTTFVMGTLVEEDKLEWDTPVRTYLPGFRMSDPIATESITPRDLVTIAPACPATTWSGTTARSPARTSSPGCPTSRPPRPAQQVPVQQHHVHGRRLPGRDDRRPPVGGGRPRRIFQPLGMGSSNFSVRDSQKADDHATPYDEHEGKVRAIPFRDITNVGPAGSINSNVTDMARWMVVHTQGGKLAGKSIISPWMLAELHTPQMTMGRPSQKKEISPIVRAGLDR